jgi:hypothetical protein
MNFVGMDEPSHGYMSRCELAVESELTDKHEDGIHKELSEAGYSKGQDKALST